jgi:hypothetical protein
MAHTLRITERPGYLHALVTGSNTRADVEGYLDELFGECKDRGIFRVLLEERLEGPRLPAEEAFRIAMEGGLRCGCVTMEIAYVDVNATGDMMRHAAAVASNRWLRVAVFPTVAEAEAWLRSDRPEGA